MNGIVEMAKMLKERENPPLNEPVIGKIIDLPDAKIRINEKVVITNEHIKTILRLDDRDENGCYINLGKEAVLLPYDNMQKYIVLGVVMNA